jgi:hypothetical protein
VCALAIDEADLSPDHPTIAPDLVNLGVLLRASGRAADAEPRLRRTPVIPLRFQRDIGHAYPNHDAVSQG